MTYQEVNAIIDGFSLETFIECRKIIHKALEKHITKRPEFVEIMLGKNGKPLYYRTWIGRK